MTADGIEDVTRVRALNGRPDHEAQEKHKVYKEGEHDNDFYAVETHGGQEQDRRGQGRPPTARKEVRSKEDNQSDRN